MKRGFELWLLAMMAALSVVALLSGCAPPKVSELLKAGVDCKAQIKLPEEPRGETVEVDVKIYDCKEVENVGR